MSRLDQIRRMSDDDLILFLRRYKSEKSSCNRCTKKDTKMQPIYRRQIAKEGITQYFKEEGEL